MAVGQNQWDPILGKVNLPPILEPILVVGLNRMLTEGSPRQESLQKCVAKDWAEFPVAVSREAEVQESVSRGSAEKLPMDGFGTQGNPCGWSKIGKWNGLKPVPWWFNFDPEQF